MLNGLVPLLVGLTTIIFVKRFAEIGIKWQYFLTKREYPLYSFVIPALIVGIGFVIIGLIDLLKYLSGK